MERFDVIGCRINEMMMDDASRVVVDCARSGQGGYVCFVNVHVSVTARLNPELTGILNASFLSMPDGKPLYWLGRLRGIQNMEQIPGPDFMWHLMEADTDPPLRHYFYGGQPEVVKDLVANIQKTYPRCVISGWESPPYREMTPQEEHDALDRIRRSRADIIWVGLGAPKQEFWMGAHWDELRPAVLMGVGAAFDFHAGHVKRSPLWLRRVGLEWLYRLLKEPRRLWRRYLVTNTLFIYYVIKDMLTSGIRVSKKPIS